MERGLTLDTGALIALERRRVPITRRIRAAVLLRDPVTVPSPVVAEWWRGSPRQRSFLELFRTGGLRVEPPSFDVSRERFTETGSSP